MVRAARVGEGAPPIVPEQLEARRLLASVTFSSGVWTLYADGTSETIFVYRVIEVSPASDRIKFQIGSTIWSRDSSDITSKVVVNAGLGDDTVHVETDQEVTNNFTALSLNAKGNDGVHKVVEVNGDDGNDTVWGGDMADTLHGGYGEDVLRGRNGNDVIQGEYGSDPLLDGGDGNDLIYGGYGDDTDTAADTLVGGDGNDTLRGEGGDDYIQTDGGADSAYGGAGNDSFYSLDGDGAGAGDFLDGGADSDTIIGTLDSSDTTVSIP